MLTLLGAFIIGLLNAALTCAIIIFIAFVCLWLLNVILGMFGWTLDANVRKWGQIVVILMCVYVFATFLLSILGMGVTPVGVHLFR